jgi:poly(hydroxyalkanoate) granule-associated protein
MVKKPKPATDEKAAFASGLFDSALAGTVKDSAQQIWLAGLGAFSKAQEEGGKVFDALVKEGATLQRKTQAAAEEKFGEVTSKMGNVAGNVGNKAGQHWDKLETIFEARTAQAMKNLGVPSAKEVDALAARVDELAAKVAALSRAARSRSTATKTTRTASAKAGHATTRAGAKRTAARRG